MYANARIKIGEPKTAVAGFLNLLERINLDLSRGVKICRVFSGSVRLFEIR